MRLLLLLALAVAACAPSEPPRASDDEVADATPATASDPANDAADDPASTALTADGWGPLRIGMTRDEVVAALGEDTDPDAVGGPDPASCDEFRPSRAPEGMLVMVEDSVLTRISLLQDAEVETVDGFGVGDEAAAVKAAYGPEATVEPHKYVPAPAEYVTVWRTGAGTPDARGLLYEIGDDGRVRAVRAGGPSIQYVEGCL